MLHSQGSLLEDCKGFFFFCLPGSFIPYLQRGWNLETDPPPTLPIVTENVEREAGGKASGQIDDITDKL